MPLTFLGIGTPWIALTLIGWIWAESRLVHHLAEKFDQYLREFTLLSVKCETSYFQTLQNFKQSFIVFFLIPPIHQNIVHHTDNSYPFQ